MSNEFTWCPGGCGSKVVIHDEVLINFCCVPCWGVFFQNNFRLELPSEVTHADPDPVPYQHSEQCKTRQMSRVHEEAVSGREFQVVTK